MTEEQFAILNQCKKREEGYARNKLRVHYKERLNWIRKKTKERTEEALPREVDGIRMEDQAIEFNTSVKVELPWTKTRRKPLSYSRTMLYMTKWMT